MLAFSGIGIFMFMGIAQGLYGPLLPQFAVEFGVGTGAVGLLFAAMGAGQVIGVLLATFAHAPVFGRAWLAVAGVLVTAGFVALPLATAWIAVLASLFIVGLGFGIVILRLNTLFINGFGTRSLSMMQLLNAAYSVGTIVGPLIIGAIHPPIRTLYGTLAAIAVLLLPMGVLAERRTMVDGAALAKSSEDNRGKTRDNAMLVGFIAMMVLVIGVEHSIAGWLATLSLAQGYSAAFAANITALFFALIFLGRLAAALVGLKFDAVFTVLSSITGVVACVALALIAGVRPFTLAMAGFAMAPFFSATLVWLGHALPVSKAANSMVICGAIVGSALFPPFVGRVIEHFGPSAAPPAILLVALSALSVALWVKARARKLPAVG